MLKPVTKSAFLDLSKASINVRNYRSTPVPISWSGWGCLIRSSSISIETRTSWGSRMATISRTMAETIFAKTSIKTKGVGAVVA